jgi:hypothetical protein
MEALPSNPLGITIREFGQATALVCSKIPAEIFNRVFGMTKQDQEHIPAILELYARHRATPLFDLNPYAVLPFFDQPDVSLVLARQGLYQGAFHQILYGVPTKDVPPTPSHPSIKEVTPEDAAEFGRTYEQVWGDGIAIRVLVGQPQFRCYLAYVDGVAAALAVLHVADGVGSMANALTVPALRGRGCQTALLYRRMHDAATLGCDLVVSQCRPGSSSQRNQLRTGFCIAGSKAWWVPIQAVAPNAASNTGVTQH